jgi:hypothetical protein
LNNILGEKGTAYTLIIQKEDKFAGDLVRNLESSGKVVPSSLMDLAMQVNMKDNYVKLYQIFKHILLFLIIECKVQKVKANDSRWTW